MQALGQQLAAAKAAEVGLRSREDIARKGQAQARVSADRNAETVVSLQVHSPAPMCPFACLTMRRLSS